MMLFLAVIEIVAVAVLAVLAVLCLYVARRVVRGGRRKTSKVVVKDGFVTLPAMMKTAQPGRYGLWLNDRHSHVLVGEVLSTGPGTVDRRILATSGALTTGALEGEWTGHVFPSPCSIADSLSVEDVTLRSDAGELPAWVIGSERPLEGRWGIHLHGIGTGRVTALRTVPAATKAGERSLVITYRNTSEGPRQAYPASTLGETEWRDLESAVRYAIAQGATSITLYAWSMGASVVRSYLQNGNLGSRIHRLVLIAPALDWAEIIRSRVSSARLPGVVASGALLVLRTRIGRVVGMAEPARRAISNDYQDVRVPTLIVHSPADPEVPVDASRAFACGNPLVTLATLPSGLHACEYNVSAESFEHVVGDWLQTH